MSPDKLYHNFGYTDSYEEVGRDVDFVITDACIDIVLIFLLSL